jgi:hypothetical protein
MAGKKGATWRRAMTQHQKDSISATKIEQRLMDHADNKIELSSTQVRALEALLDRRKPKLSAVDNTVSVRESWSESLQRIADARKDAAVSAPVIPLKDQA